MLNLGSVIIFSEETEKLADFYGKVFDKEPEWAGGGYFGFTVGNTFLSIGPHDKVKGKNSNPERIMLNFETSDVQGEFKRIKDIKGVKIIAEPYTMGEETKAWIATFADPDGNYFQLVTPWEDMSKVN